MPDPIAPTCKELWEEKLGEVVFRSDDASWRHGSYRTEVYHRESDNTFWETCYAVSTDGETNGLRTDDAGITRVYPHEIKAIVYKAKP